LWVGEATLDSTGAQARLFGHVTGSKNGAIDMGHNLLLATLAAQSAVITALLGGIVWRIGGAPMTGAIGAGAAAFVATLTLALMLMSTVGLM
jgi:hypothetical protein